MDFLFLMCCWREGGKACLDSFPRNIILYIIHVVLNVFFLLCFCEWDPCQALMLYSSKIKRPSWPRRRFAQYAFSRNRTVFVCSRTIQMLFVLNIYHSKPGENTTRKSNKVAQVDPRAGLSSLLCLHSLMNHFCLLACLLSSWTSHAFCWVHSLQVKGAPAWVD